MAIRLIFVSTFLFAVSQCLGTPSGSEAVAAEPAPARTQTEQAGPRVTVAPAMQPHPSSAEYSYQGPAYPSYGSSLIAQNLASSNSSACPGQYQCTSTRSLSTGHISQFPGYYPTSSMFGVPYSSRSQTAQAQGQGQGQGQGQALPKCISWASVCDGFKDCPNRDDESGCKCSTSSVYYSSSGPGDYRCKGQEKRCIPQGWLCDGTADCEHREDEDKALCANGHNRRYYCLGSNSLDIPWTYRCDGEKDCPSGEDEKYCDPAYPEPKCPPNTHVCKGSSTCIEKTKLCDNVLDCPRGEDEDNCDSNIR